MIIFNFLDLFSGIGGFRFGMEQAGFYSVGWVEKDKYARMAYEAIHNPEGEWSADDITTVTDKEIRSIGRADIITGGFPCQAFSIAGKQRGFADTRGTLFFEIARFASILQPKYLFLENVPGLLSHDGGNTFETILKTMDELGYDAEWQMCDSKNYLPQSRKRVFIIGHLRGRTRSKIFPLTREASPINCTDEIRAVLAPDRLIKQQNGRRFKDPGETMFTLTAQDRHGIAILNDQGRVNKKHKLNDICPTLRDNSHRIRKLSPLECWRLQGFPDSAFYKAKDAGISDAQLYKMAGNAVSVPVIFDIARRLESIL